MNDFTYEPHDTPVLVTGATGFTGGHLAAALRRRGQAVRALCRPGADTTKLKDCGVEIVEGDLLSEADVRRAVEGVCRVYHIAAVYRSAKFPKQYYFDVNAGGTERLLAAARQEKVGRFVHCSTVGVHGEIASCPADESAPMAPGDVYQESKLQGERVAKKAIHDGLPGVIFRPAGIYGPGDTRFLKLFKSIQRGTFRMIGPGTALYQMIYIDDLVDGMILCGEHPVATGNTYILTGAHHGTIAELVKLVAEAVGKPTPRGRIPLAPVAWAATLCEMACRPLGLEPPLHRRRLDFFTKDRAFSIAKARQELGFQPKVPLADGLKLTATWYQEAGWL